MRPTILAAALTLVLAGAVRAEEAIATANGRAAPVMGAATGPAPLPDEPMGSALRDDPERLVVGPCGPTKATADGKPDRAPHGQVEVGVGTGGYRHIAGVVCKPIGDNAAVTVAVSQTQWNGGRRPRR